MSKPDKRRVHAAKPDFSLKNTGFRCGSLFEWRFKFGLDLIDRMEQIGYVGIADELNKVDR